VLFLSTNCGEKEMLKENLSGNFTSLFDKKDPKTFETLNSIKMRRYFDYLVILIMAAVLIFASYLAFNTPALIAICRR